MVSVKAGEGILPAQQLPSSFTIHYIGVNMSSTFTIELQGLRFFAAHGLYPEELRVGNEFELNIAIIIKAPKDKIVSLENTVNYAEVYRIASEVFSVRKNLLETLAMEIAEALKEQFPEIKKSCIQVSKLAPPITAFTGAVSITYNRSYNEKKH